MSDDEIRVAIAEKCGWKWYRRPASAPWADKPHRSLYHPQISSEYVATLTKADMTERQCNYVFIWSEGMIPDYPRDLNACHEFEKTLFNDPGKWPDFAEQLTVVCFGVKTGLNDLGHIKAAYVAHATARQRCEAFLRTFGLWKENPIPERSENRE